MKVLVVSRDMALAESLAQALATAGIDLVVQGEPAWSLGAKGVGASLLVFDLGEGSPAQWRWLGEWLRAGGLPAIVLGPFSRNECDPVRALHMGADDYMPRPLCLEELALRISTVSRRARVAVGADAAEAQDGDLELDPDNCSASVGGRQISLTPTEFRLLEELACQEGHPVSRQVLTSHVWGSEDAVTDTNLSLYIWNLRQKLEADPARPRLIVTRRGMGYVFRGRLGRGATV
jgi:DNA-binding response OmpR family regulator